MKLAASRAPRARPRLPLRGRRAAGSRRAAPDVALIVLDAPGGGGGRAHDEPGAGGARCVVTRERLRAGAASAVLVHAGNANACTGPRGRRTVEESTALAAALLGVAGAARSSPCATGRIGVQVPRDAAPARRARRATRALAAGGFPAAAQAITTTDAFPKTAVRRVRLGGRAGHDRGARRRAPA